MIVIWVAHSLDRRPDLVADKFEGARAQDALPCRIGLVQYLLIEIGMNALSAGIASNVSIASRVLRCYRTSGEQTRNAALAHIDHRYLRELNPAQRSAVEYGIGGDRRSAPALLIAAGAGTGKTKTLVHRVAHLILDGADPHRLLLPTLTRRAALEMSFWPWLLAGPDRNFT